MNYGEARDNTLKIINQYSIAGARIASSYNNQNDYLLRIPALINDAELIIARGPRRLEASMMLAPECAVELGGMYRYTFPEDMLEPVPGGLMVLDDGGTSLFSGYTVLDDDYFLVPKTLQSTAFLRYYRRPQLLPDNPVDTAPLDNVAIAQEPIPYYAAAMLVLQEDEYANSVLFNMWQDKLNDIGKLTQAERHIIKNVYGDQGGWGEY